MRSSRINAQLPDKLPGKLSGKLPDKLSHKLPGKLQEKHALLLLAVPFVAIVFVFSYLPLYGWIYAFTNYTPGLPVSDWIFVGFKNFFMSIFFDRYMLTVLRNTLVLSGLNIFCMWVPIAFALLLSELGSARFKKIVQTASTLPFYISWITIYSLVYAIFSNEGLIKQISLFFGVTNFEVSVLGNADIAWFFQTALSVWKSAGYSAILYFAAIAAIDTEQFDAARVDGAGRFATILYITLPGIANTFFVLLLLSTANLFSNGFDQYFVFYNPMVAEKLEVLDYYIYSVALSRSINIPYATAVGILKTALSLSLLFGCNAVSKKIRGESLF